MLFTSSSKPGKTNLRHQKSGNGGPWGRGRGRGLGLVRLCPGAGGEPRHSGKSPPHPQHSPRRGVHSSLPCETLRKLFFFLSLKSLWLLFEEWIKGSLRGSCPQGWAGLGGGGEVAGQGLLQGLASDSPSEWSPDETRRPAGASHLDQTQTLADRAQFIPSLRGHFVQRRQS